MKVIFLIYQGTDCTERRLNLAKSPDSVYTRYQIGLSARFIDSQEP